MKLFEQAFNKDFTSYVRLQDSDTKESEIIKLDGKREYYEPSSNGNFTYLLDDTIKMKRCFGNYKEAKDKYGVRSSSEVYIRDNHWRKSYVKKPRIWYLDIETRALEPIDVEKVPNAITLIQIYDTFLDTMIVFGLRDFEMRDDYPLDFKVKYIKCTDEVDLVKKYLGVFKKLNPLIIYAWNGVNFDYQYLKNRFIKLGFDTNSLSNYGEASLQVYEDTAKFKANGHYYLDMMLVYKDLVYGSKPSYSLDYISSIELNDKKVEHDEFLSFDSFYSGKDYQIKDTPYDEPIREEIRQLKIKEHNNTITEEETKLLEQKIQFMFVYYGIKDVYLLKKLDEKLNFTNILINISELMGVNIEDATSTIKPWNTYINNICYEKGLCFPPNQQYEIVEGIVGGFVREPLQGKHKWVTNFDVNSMYPMLSMVGFNMSAETYVAVNKLPSEIREIVLTYFNDQDEAKRLEMPLEVQEKLSELLKKHNLSIAVNGACFKCDQKGIIPQLVEEIYYGRKKDKKTMLKYEGVFEKVKGIISSNSFGTLNIIKDPLEYTDEELHALDLQTLEYVKNESEYKEHFYHIQQMVKKILINSVYGALGKTAFKLFNEKIAQAITSNGRYFIQKTANMIENKLQTIKPYASKYVVYGDTDSVYYTIAPFVEQYSKQNNVTDVMELVEWSAKFEESIVDPIIQRSIKEFATLFNAYSEESIGAKREIIADNCLFVAKKKYIARVRDAEGVRYPLDNPHMKVMGLELARSNTPKWCKEKLTQSLDIILEKDEKTLRTWINSLREEFKTIPIEDICMNASVPSKDTDPSRSWMLKASLCYNRYIEDNNLTKYFSKLQSGDKIKIMFLTMPNPLMNDRIGFTDAKILKHFEKYIDYNTAFDKLLISPIQNIVKALSYDVRKVEVDFDEW